MVSAFFIIMVTGDIIGTHISCNHVLILSTGLATHLLTSGMRVTHTKNVNKRREADQDEDGLMMCSVYLG